MQPVEAITRLIALADIAQSRVEDISDLSLNNYDDNQLAIAVIQAMLNTALPVARFRAHVSIETIGKGSTMGLGDFTTCGVSIASIRNGLVGLGKEKVYVSASLWEQRATGATMLNGYQGDTKTLPFRNWLKSLDQFEQPLPTVQ